MNKNYKKIVLPAFALLMVAGAYAQTGKITTIAGTGTSGYSGDGAAATTAKLFAPSGVAVDLTGNVYIADKTNSRIRKISKTGVITTIAGNGTGAYTGDNAAATLASISSPTGVVVDLTGNVYIADYGNNCVRKVSATGIITTVAGNNVAGAGGDNGPATAASLSSPSALALDASGNLYIADQSNGRIRKVTAGIITTVAGGGSLLGDGGAATIAQLSVPSGVAVDASGNIYIADQGNNRIRKVTAAGIISTFAGTGVSGYSGSGGLATAAQFNFPIGVAVDNSNNVYVAEGNSDVIRKISMLDTIVVVAGNDTSGYSGDNAAATAAKINNPSAIAIDTAGNIFIADVGNNRVRKVTKAVVVSHAGVNALNTENSSITLMPNPNAGVFTVKGPFNSLNDESVTLQVTDLLGRVIYSSIAQTTKGILNTQIMLNDIADGTYLLNVRSGSEMNVSRFVIRK